MKEGPEAAFDSYAGEYDKALARGLCATGETRDYFARGRLLWLSRRLRGLEYRLSVVLDFGCGTGSSTPYLLQILGADSVLGVDVSEKSLEIAARDYGSERVRFRTLEDYQPCEEADLAFCNGVFHHIPLAKRLDRLGCIHRALRPGGLLAFWENNPWNPGTRYVMSRIPFDRDAIPLSPWEALSLLRSCGFEVLQLDFLFIFPRALRFLRWVEPFVAKLPLGGQYQVLCRKR